MRTLLEIHYDEVHAERYTGPRCSSLLSSVAYAHRQKLNQKLVIPIRVKQIMRRSSDETDPAKLELLLHAVRAEIEGETDVYLASVEDIQKLAAAVANCETLLADEIGESCKGIPAGSRLVLDVPVSRCVEESRKSIVQLIMGLEPGDAVRVKTRPMDSRRRPLLDTFGRFLMQNGTRSLEHLRTVMDMSIEDARDHLLLVFWA